jgi:hypothetical protein
LQTQLAQMATNHGARILQINEQAVAERKALEEAFKLQMAEFGYHSKAWLEEQAKLQNDSRGLFLRWYAGQLTEAEQGAQGYGRPTKYGPSTPTPYADGGPVTSTGLALLHRGEYVVPAGKNGAWPQGAGGGVALTLAAGSIVVNESSRPGQTAMEIRAALVALIQEAA